MIIRFLSLLSPLFCEHTVYLLCDTNDVMYDNIYLHGNYIFVYLHGCSYDNYMYIFVYLHWCNYGNYIYIGVVMITTCTYLIITYFYTYMGVVLLLQCTKVTTLIAGVLLWVLCWWVGQASR